MENLVQSIGNQSLDTYIKPTKPAEQRKSLTFLNNIQATGEIFKANVVNQASHKICFDLEKPNTRVSVNVGDKSFSFIPGDLMENQTGRLFCKLVINLRDDNLPEIKINLSSSVLSDVSSIKKFKFDLNDQVTRTNEITKENCVCAEPANSTKGTIYQSLTEYKDNKLKKEYSFSAEDGTLKTKHYVAQTHSSPSEDAENKAPSALSGSSSTEHSLCQISEAAFIDHFVFLAAENNSWLAIAELHKKLEASHIPHELSGANSNCWWRAAWAIIFTTADPQVIFKKITDLKPLFTSLQEDDPLKKIDPQRFRDSAVEAQTNFTEILTDTKPSRIKYHDVNEESQPVAEEHLKLLTFAILKKTSEDIKEGEISNQQIETLSRQISGNELGGHDQIRDLVKFFNADFVMLCGDPSTPSSTVHDGAWFGLHDKNQLAALQEKLKISNTSEKCLNTIQAGWRNKVVLRINRSHYNVFFPKNFAQRF